MTCPGCRRDARCKGFRGRSALTLLGALRFRRHYYHCRHCGQGTSPLDEALGLSAADLTPAADEVVCLAGVQDSFAVAAAKVLARLSGLRVSESTALRATEAAGRRVARAQAAGTTFGPPTPWSWHKDAEGKTVAYVSADATGVGQQGEGGAAAEGRMAYVGMIYNPVPDDRRRWADPRGRRPGWQARYVAQVRPLAQLAEPLRRQGGQVGMGRAERWVALADGGSGLEDFLRDNFPRVEAVILDFYHVAEYLGKLAKALHPGQEEAAEAWRQQWCHRLKAEGGGPVLEALRRLDLRGTSPAARAVHDEVVTYFGNQEPRMDYPAYLARGWQIGSGPVESACKTVVGQRLKGGGMRWGADGADAVCHLRALFRSADRQWEAFWSRN
ncbi:MAG TPA: ISKra4 family transposase [Gemmataceae bacterium]|nr:ISKra4 family transposase [Gemmataceae bacterium]